MWKDLRPEEIERMSFDIIRSEMEKSALSKEEQWVLLRVIHASADFGFQNTLYFSENAARVGIEALRAGAAVVADTNMALTGIGKSALASYGGVARCYMGDEDVAKEAKRSGALPAPSCRWNARLSNIPTPCTPSATRRRLFCGCASSSARGKRLLRSLSVRRSALSTSSSPRKS